MNSDRKWVKVPDFPKYFISEYGELWSEKSKRILKNRLNAGYYYYSLSNGEISNFFMVHRLVASVFISNPDSLPFVNHIDGVKTNNHYSNLRWATRSEISINNVEKGLIKYNKRSVCQLDKEKNLIATYPSITEASEKTNIGLSQIIDACQKRVKSAHGFCWCYEENLEEFKKEKIAHGGNKKVLQIEPETGDIIKEWGSVKEAANSLGANPSSIGNACSKSLKIKKYLWKFSPKIEEEKEKHPGEVWPKIPNFPKYTVSQNGEIYSLFIKRLMKQYTNIRGYKSLGLKDENGKQTTITVHVIVAQVYVPNPDDKPEVCHKNDNREDSRAENLFWGTSKDNAQDMVEKGRCTGSRPIQQIDNGNIISTFPSIAEASRKTGIKHSTLSFYLKREDGMGQIYTWKYVTSE